MPQLRDNVFVVTIFGWPDGPTPSNEDLKDLNSLLAQLAHEDDLIMPTVTTDSFMYHMRFGAHALVVARDTKMASIIGMASLHFKHLMKEGIVADVEEVVVDAQYRGQGVAERLNEALEDAARSRGVRFLRLTSAPWREAANKFYARMGYTRYATNNYRKKLA